MQAPSLAFQVHSLLRPLHPNRCRDAGAPPCRRSKHPPPRGSCFKGRRWGWRAGQVGAALARSRLFGTRLRLRVLCCRFSRFFLSLGEVRGSSCEATVPPAAAVRPIIKHSPKRQLLPAPACRHAHMQGCYPPSSPLPPPSLVAQRLCVQVEGAAVGDAHVQAGVVRTKHLLHRTVCGGQRRQQQEGAVGYRS